MDANRFRRIRTSLRKLVSAVTAFAMIAVGLVVVPVIAQVAGAQPAAAGTYSPYAYVANFTAGTVTVVRLSDNSTQATIPVGAHPTGIAISPDGTKGYVANQGDSTVSIFSTASNTVTNTVTVGSGPFGVAFAPDGTKAYVTNGSTNTVSVITTATASVAKTITVGTSPWGLAITPDGARVYVSNNGTTTVSVIATATDSTTNTVGVGSSPAGLGITPDGSKVFVTNNGAATVSVIQTSNNTVAATTSVASGPRVVAIAPDGLTAYVASTGINTVTPISVATNAALAGIASPGGPYGGAMIPDQAPTAVLAAISSSEAMTVVTFDASGSSHASGTIANYAWAFGDGTTANTAGPTTTHRYPQDGSYTATVTLTDTLGTSTAPVFTGQTMTRNGKATARATRTVTISTPFSVTAPGIVSFSGAITGTNQSLSTTMPLAVSNGASAGWSLSATSTQWTTGGASPKVLPLTATTVANTPIVTCDVGGACNLAANSIGYPYVLPAGVTAPTATKLFNAGGGSGIGRQTVTPTLRLSVPGSSHAGTYHSTITVTLSSGP